MSTRAVSMLVLFVAVGVGAAAYMVGVAHGRAVPAASVAPIYVAQPVQRAQLPESPTPFQGPAPAPQPFQAPAPQAPQTGPGQVPQQREFIPIPGPGDQTPGMRPQQQNGECEPMILFYHNGQLYQMKPGQGPQDGQGRPGAPPEFFPLNPYQGPPIPGLPLPRPDRGPGFTPLNPRS
jgi:hypothetical protein